MCKIYTVVDSGDCRIPWCKIGFWDCASNGDTEAEPLLAAAEALRASCQKLRL